MVLGTEAPGKLRPAQTRQGGLKPMSAGFVSGAVPRNGLTYSVGCFCSLQGPRESQTCHKTSKHRPHSFPSVEIVKTWIF